MSTDDVAQRARAALDGITPGPWWWTAETRARLIALGADKHELTDAREIIRCAALLHPGEADARFIAAAPDLVRKLAAEVEKLRAQPVELSAQLLADAAGWEAVAEEHADTIGKVDAEVEKLCATVERVRELAEHWANPKIRVDGQAPPIRPEHAARVILRALDGEV